MLKKTFKRILVVSAVLTLITATILFYYQSFQTKLPSSTHPIHLYSNQNRQDLKLTFKHALGQAQKKIFIIMFSFTDKQLIQILNQQAEKGVEVSIVCDRRNPKKILKQLHPSIQYTTPKEKGLLHQKIIIIDDETLYIGSSNLTTLSLRMHDNLMMGVWSPHMIENLDYSESSALLPQNLSTTFEGQTLELWTLPDQKNALNRILNIIDSAEQSIYIAMFTWTHPLITEHVIQAHKRGISVICALDYQSSLGASRKTYERLQQESIPIIRNQGPGLLHHKFAVIDNKILINGSTNWTKSAFQKNRDCFFILYPLNQEQVTTISQLWKAIEYNGR